MNSAIDDERSTEMATKVKVAKHGRNAGWWVVRDAIKNGQEFSNSNRSWRGTQGNAPMWQTGQLPSEYELSAHAADYVVWSYNTPIAWRVDGEWITPDCRYSVTTSYHQGRTFTAISQL